MLLQSLLGHTPLWTSIQYGGKNEREDTVSHVAPQKRKGGRGRWPSCFDRLRHHQRLLRHLQGGRQASAGRRPDSTTEPASAEFFFLGGGTCGGVPTVLPAFPQARHVTYTVCSTHVDIVPVLQIRDVYPGSWFFTHPGSQIPDFGSQIQKPQQKRGAKTFFVVVIPFL